MLILWESELRCLFVVFRSEKNRTAYFGRLIPKRETRRGAGIQIHVLMGNSMTDSSPPHSRRYKKR